MRRRSNRQWKNGTCERFWGQWRHLAIMQGHASDSKRSWSSGVASFATCLSKPITPGQIQDRSAASTSWPLAPVTYYPPRLRHPGYFGHVRPSVWLCSCSNFDLGQDQKLWFWSAVSFKLCSVGLASCFSFREVIHFHHTLLSSSVLEDYFSRFFLQQRLLLSFVFVTDEARGKSGETSV